MSRVRSADTVPEIAFRRALWAIGLRYRVRARLPGTPDLAFPKLRLTIFVDGCFWHACPRHYGEPKSNVGFWRTKIAANRERDRRVNRELRKLGWRVVRIWEHELRENLPGAVARIRQLLTRAAAT
ncbi:MAG: very short patch repair endonuclease [Acidobacteria bacterium]|nr:very short patch repair endonuclease [Acidobacteriota bacterium]